MLKAVIFTGLLIFTSLGCNSDQDFESKKRSAVPPDTIINTSSDIEPESESSDNNLESNKTYSRQKPKENLDSNSVDGVTEQSSSTPEADAKPRLDFDKIIVRLYEDIFYRLPTEQEKTDLVIALSKTSNQSERKPIIANLFTSTNEAQLVIGAEWFKRFWDTDNEVQSLLDKRDVQNMAKKMEKGEFIDEIRQQMTATFSTETAYTRMVDPSNQGVDLVNWWKTHANGYRQPFTLDYSDFWVQRLCQDLFSKRPTGRGGIYTATQYTDQFHHVPRQWDAVFRSQRIEVENKQFLEGYVVAVARYYHRYLDLTKSREDLLADPKVLSIAKLDEESEFFDSITGRIEILSSDEYFSIQ